MNQSNYVNILYKWIKIDAIIDHNWTNTKKRDASLKTMTNRIDFNLNGMNGSFVFCWKQMTCQNGNSTQNNGWITHFKTYSNIWDAHVLCASINLMDFISKISRE